ncbi:hypothetical protein BU25DRAFT_495227 [Macroventuria anomochaeta]|uniref:Uncharacterized protein n=1 Tax=Macroventuria anomochaeta TaxID=301207 RepID=A0ACB6RK94_9PLEO|nr:uncharacterized protein BU25DRAFT_495227 [Macroventuria anomochaeta]KAF2622316.1 hypothetical protein BU25DRAFT_495227 [Macroventuria anomochaeta]
MSSGDESAQELSSANDAPQQARAASRRQSRTPGTRRKRRRIESAERSRVRKYYLEGKYSDAYRVLFNGDVSRAAARFESTDGLQHYATQYGASVWSGKEQATLFAALGRLGRDDAAGIAQAIGTKTVTETRELLLLLEDAAVEHRDVGMTLRDIPAAIEVGQECTEELDVMAEALAWYQEQWEVSEEQKRCGDYWLITPAVAEDMEAAINGPSRAASTRPTTPAEPGTPHAGPGITGSCVRCKHHKIRCDRKVPCTNCARLKRKVACKYKRSKRNVLSVDLTPQAPTMEEAQDQAPQPGIPAQSQILQAIPQASLLHAENMLSLSKDLFMNRSPDLPSPWPHWSAYASEQVPEPSILRTAFNDFHALAVSVTKRLMQTAILEATSRLRSQRRRTKKGVMPLVKTRDVLSAIDVLGMKRNGRSQWTGAARRCNVRVFDEQRTTRFKIKQREISWDQAEQILGLYDAVTAPSASDARATGSAADSEDEKAFRQRAARHGTPLPMEHLSLSNSDSDVETEDDAAGSDSASSDDRDEELTDSVKHQIRDSIDRSSSAEPGEATQDHVRGKQTLEQFDQEASRREEEALCNLLGFTTTIKQKSPHGDGSEVDSDDGLENFVTSADDWRNWTEYHATWEEHQTPVPSARFAANQQPRKTTPASRLNTDSDASSTASGSPQQTKHNFTGVVELRVRDPRTYAAMQNHASGIHSDSAKSDLSGSDDDMDADVPAQSVENTEVPQNSDVQDAMDWET